MHPDYRTCALSPETATPWNLRTAEHVFPSKRRPCSEKPCAREQPPLMAIREKPRQQWRPPTAKSNLIKFFKKLASYTCHYVKTLSRVRRILLVISGWIKFTKTCKIQTHCLFLKGNLKPSDCYWEYKYRKTPEISGYGHRFSVYMLKLKFYLSLIIHQI